ncbi:MAG: tRNA (adenine-N1)-methyltransferase [Chloroflexi bacterium]|nr:tRNA (adenine-N1)-methyltransferase [Chloroflexota bacterium]
MPLPWKQHGTHAQEGDLVQLVGLKHKHFLVRLQSGGVFQTHRGVLHHDDIIGLPWGSQITSHNGSPFFLLQPSLADLLREIKRVTQILYPKDIGFILVSMGIGPGQHVLEAGTGSGAMAAAFAYAVGPQGHVTTYEAREQMQSLAKANLASLGLDDRVTFKLGNVEQGFEERGVDALFLDLPNPFDYIPQVREALKPGGFFGCILPTVPQVMKLLTALRQNRFAFIDVCEVLLRYYKPEPSRFRPTDRMVAHTGYLIFARPVLLDPAKANQALMKEAGLISELEPDGEDAVTDSAGDELASPEAMEEFEG